MKRCYTVLIVWLEAISSLFEEFPKEDQQKLAQSVWKHVIDDVYVSIDLIDCQEEDADWDLDYVASDNHK